eukprot:1360506-Pyramimonas_sp.AAC.1
MSILGKTTPSRSSSAASRRTPKPIGWTVADDQYSGKVREQLGLEPLPVPGQGPPLALHIYTDGSCVSKRRRTISAGWGFVAFDFGTVPCSEQEPLLTAFGPVILD